MGHRRLRRLQAGRDRAQRRRLLRQLDPQEHAPRPPTRPAPRRKGNTVGRIMQFRVSGAAGRGHQLQPGRRARPLRVGPMIRLWPGAAAAADPPADPERGDGHAGQTAIDPVTGVTDRLPRRAAGDPGQQHQVGRRADHRRSTPSPMMHVHDGAHPRLHLDDHWRNYLSELPKEGDTEVWEIVNLTADAHPIHLHLVQFQLINRQAFDANKYTTAYAAAFPGGYDYTTGRRPARRVTSPASARRWTTTPATPPARWAATRTSRPSCRDRPDAAAAHEAGWKDTVIMLPGQVTRIAVRWAPTDLAGEHAASRRLLPVRPAAPAARLRLALPHRRPRGQRDDAAGRGHPQRRARQDLRQGDDWHSPTTNFRRPSGGLAAPGRPGPFQEEHPGARAPKA